MKIGDEILIKAKIVDFDSNPHGAAIKVEIVGFDPKSIDKGWSGGKKKEKVEFWIHRLDQPETIVKIKQ